MIGSHLDNDHIAAQADIINNFQVSEIYYPDDIFNCVKNGTCTSFDQEHIVDTLRSSNKTPKIIKPPKKVVVGDMTLYFLAPNKIGSNKNENSFIFILKYQNNTFMFTGDAGSQLSVDALQSNASSLGISLKIDVLKYPHHGNGHISSTFLSTAKPKYVIVPNYYAPKYPSAENQAKLNSYGITTYRQSDSSTGNILITSDGNKISIINNVNASTYKR